MQASVSRRQLFLALRTTVDHRREGNESPSSWNPFEAPDLNSIINNGDVLYNFDTPDLSRFFQDIAAYLKDGLLNF